MKSKSDELFIKTNVEGSLARTIEGYIKIITKR